MHTIRLREPWTIEAQSDRVIYRRHFNRPTGLGPGNIVRLTIESLMESAVVDFNGEALCAGDTSWDITASLQTRNVIEISAAPSAPTAPRPFGEVALLISDL